MKSKHTRARLATGAGALSLVGALVTTGAGPVDAAFPGRNGRIYCTSAQTGNNEIFSYEPDGSFPRQLTLNAANDLEPTPSPDGVRVAFTSTREGDQDIWMMYQDGSGLRKLTTTLGEDRPGSFSPDSTKLSFHSARFGPVPPGTGHSALEILTMNIDGTGVTRLTNNNFQDSFAHWSPAGDQIAITSNRTLDFEIWRISTVDGNADGNADTQIQVTTSPGEDSHAHWSPDATQIVFHSRRDATPENTGIIEIYRASSVDGSGPVRLTNDNVFDAFPAWSPDGQKIVWPREFPGDVWTMNASDGSAKTNITPGLTGDQTRCDWAPLLACTISGAGLIQGTAGDDVICGSSGQDQIFGLGGNDVIYPGPGNDYVDAGPGNDKVFGDRGFDRILGGADNDILFGDQDNDQVDGGPGNDIVSGSEGNDQAIGGDGTDECYGEGMLTCEAIV